MSGMANYSCRMDQKTWETVCGSVAPKTPTPQPGASRSGEGSPASNKSNEAIIDPFSAENLSLPDMSGEGDAFVKTKTKTQKTGEKSGEVLVGSTSDHAKFTKEATGNTYEFTRDDVVFGANLKHTVTAPKEGSRVDETIVAGKIGFDTDYQLNQQRMRESGDAKKVVTVNTAFGETGNAKVENEENYSGTGSVARKSSVLTSIGNQDGLGNLNLSNVKTTGTDVATANETILGYKTTQLAATARQKLASDGNFEKETSLEWNSQNEPTSTVIDSSLKTVSYTELQIKQAEAEAKAKEQAKPSGTSVKMRQLKTGNTDSAKTVTTAGVTQKIGSTGTIVGIEQVKTDTAGQGSNKSSVTFEQMLFDDPSVAGSGGKLSANYTTETEQKAAASIAYDSKTVSLGYTSAGGNRAATATYNFTQAEGENARPLLVSKVGVRRELNPTGKDNTSVFAEGSLPVTSSANMVFKTGYSTGEARTTLEAALNQKGANGDETSFAGGIGQDGKPYVRAEIKRSF